VFGTLNQNITDGAMMSIQAKKGFLTILNDNLDFCAELVKQGLACPYPAGPFEFTYTRPISDNYPNTSVKLTVNVTNGDGVSALCLTGKVDITKV
jgi:hypothetical protein